MNRILIIEDDEDIANLEKDYLEKDGFEADIAVKGDEGLRLALSGDYGYCLSQTLLELCLFFLVHGHVSLC